MNVIVSLAVGVLVGWLASVLTGTDGRENLSRNVMVGVAGAYAGGWILSTLIEAAQLGGFSLGGMIASFFGAAALLLLVTRLSRA